MISACVGKSGPLIILHKSFVSAFSFSTRKIKAFATSLKLCGGMEVAMPTAMPVVPLSRMLGRRAGIREGSSRVPSKLGTHSTVPCSSSSKKIFAYLDSLDSVYRMAAKDLGSLGSPQLPCPSTNGYLKENGWA